MLPLSPFYATCDHHKFCISSTFAVTTGIIKADRPNQSHSICRRPWNFSSQRRIAGTIRRPAALVIAVNQFRREIDGKSQFHGRSPFFCFFSFFLSHRALCTSFSLAPSSLFPSFSFVSPFPDVYATLVRPRKSWNSIDRVALWALPGWIKVSSWKSPMYLRLNVFLSNKRYSR